MTENWKERAEKAEALLAHIWLHVTSDENFDADEIKRDIERGIGGSIDELQAYPDAVALIRDMAFDDYKRETVTPANAFDFFGKCNQRLVGLRDRAKALLPRLAPLNDQQPREERT